jgi:hypothetical protein
LSVTFKIATKDKLMVSVFMSYRRSDQIALTGRVYDRLVQKFGSEQVFKDVEDIPAGSDFRKVLEQALTRADILLAMIGPGWLNAADSQGRRRLDNPDDFVRLEISTALKRSDVLVIPVLLDNAKMPAANHLPSDMKDLAYRNGIVLRNDPDFNSDMKELIEIIEEKAEQMAPRRKLPLPLIGLGLLLLAALVIGGLVLANNGQAQPTPTAAALSASATVEPTATAAEVEASPTATSVPPTGTPAPTVLYPDGRPVEMFYDTTSFYLKNAASSGRLELSQLAFQALDAAGAPIANRVYQGSDIVFSDFPFVEAGKCFEVVVAGQSGLKPATCQSYNAQRQLGATSTRIIWTADAAPGGFRVLWNEREIARCLTGTGLQRCEVNLPPR